MTNGGATGKGTSFPATYTSFLGNTASGLGTPYALISSSGASSLDYYRELLSERVEKKQRFSEREMSLSERLLRMYMMQPSASSAGKYDSPLMKPAPVYGGINLGLPTNSTIQSAYGFSSPSATKMYLPSYSQTYSTTQPC